MANETEVLQTKLYARSDAATLERVKEATGTLSGFLGANQATQHMVPLKVRTADLYNASGEKIHGGMSNDDITRVVLNGSAVLKVPAYVLVQALTETLAVSLKSDDRKKYVEEFVREVERLRDEVDDLGARLGAVE